MLIDVLNDIEKKTEVMKDKDQIRSFIPSIFQWPDYKRKVKKALNFPFNYIAHFKSKRGNSYQIYITPTDKKKGADNPLVGVYTRMQSKEGIYVARYDIVKDHITLFTPHFFKRYRERFLKDDEMDMDEVIKTYLKRNPNQFSTPRETFTVCNDGAIFIKEVDKQMCIGVTFVSNDMQRDEQKEEWEKALEELGDFEDYIKTHIDNNK